MFSFPGLFSAASAQAPAAAPNASFGLIATDLAAGGWLLVGLTATAVLVLFLVRDRQAPPRRARQLAPRLRLRSGWIAGRPFAAS